jgi:hypothetical protein
MVQVVASGTGRIAMMHPDWPRVASPQARDKVERLLGATLDERPGLTGRWIPAIFWKLTAVKRLF